MTRAKNPDTTTDAPDTNPQTAPDDTPQPDSTEQASPATARNVTAVSVPDDDLYEPYPGAEFFHGGRNSPIVAAMGGRLEQEGLTQPGQSLGPDWTNSHKRAFAAWQHQLRPKEAGDVSGIPDEVAWNKLHIPRVTPQRQAGGQ